MSESTLLDSRIETIEITPWANGEVPTTDLPGASALIEGPGFYSSAHVRVRISPRRGPTLLSVGQTRGAISSWRVVADERTTTLQAPLTGVRLRGVEHLFAALGALEIYEGVHIEVMDGWDLPLLDGGASEWMRALSSVRVAPSRAPLRVVRDETITIGKSIYTFLLEASAFGASGCARGASVTVDLLDPRVARDASWCGDADDFAKRIAAARTFVFAGELEELAARGYTAHVRPESVVVLGRDVLAAGAPFTADEPPRHKLLDLIGDLYVHGGPPQGWVHAYRPGHAATHAAVKEALTRGVLARN